MSKNACFLCSQKGRVLISTLASFELFDVLPCSSSPDNSVSLDSCTLLTSDLLLLLVSHYVVCIYIHLSCNSYCTEYQIYYRKDKMLLDCMFSQPYQSLIESQNCCLDNSNPNSVIGSTVSQSDTPVRVDIHKMFFFVIHFCC